MTKLAFSNATDNVSENCDFNQKVTVGEVGITKSV